MCIRDRYALDKSMANNDDGNSVKDVVKEVSSSTGNCSKVYSMKSYFFKSRIPTYIRMFKQKFLNNWLYFLQKFHCSFLFHL